MSNAKPTYDEHSLLKSIAEKIFAIEYIAKGDLKSAFSDIYGKRESILALSVAMWEYMSKLNQFNSKYKEIFGKDIYRQMHNFRNVIAHDYNTFKPNVATYSLRFCMKRIKFILKNNFEVAFNAGYGAYKSNVRYKESNNQKSNLAENIQSTKNRVFVEQGNNIDFKM